MKLSIRNPNQYIGFSTALLVFKISVCLSSPISEDKPSATQLHSLRAPLNVDLGSTKKGPLFYPDHIQKIRPDMGMLKVLEGWTKPRLSHASRKMGNKRSRLSSGKRNFLHKRHQNHNRLPSESPNIESCCPSVKEIVEPIAGRNRSGDLVELYQTDNVRQRFYETSCDPSIVNKRCRYLDKRHLANSKCEQQYSYAYVRIKDYGSQNDNNSGGRINIIMDYIQLRSGCACRIHVP